MPVRSYRFLVAIAVAIAAGALVYRVVAVLHVVTDLEPTLYAGRALLSGANPYQLIGPDARPFLWPWGWSYPVPAGLVLAPLVSLGRLWATVAFTALGVGLMAWSITRQSWVPLMALASAPALMAIRLAQWAPWMTAAMFLPWLAWLVVCKPNVGVVAFAGMSVRGWRAAAYGSLPLIFLAFVILPNWPDHWRTSVAAIPVYAPLIVRPGGFVMLAALAKWRRWDARVLLASVCIPGTPSTVDALVPMVAVMMASSRAEAMALALVSFASIPLATWLGHLPDERGTLQAMVTLCTVSIPLLVAVLRRPNCAAVTLHPPVEADYGPGDEIAGCR